MKNLGTNIAAEVKDNKLTLVIDLEHRGGRSKSGKTTLVATSHGNIEVPNSDGVKIGINAFVK